LPRQLAYLLAAIMPGTEAAKPRDRKSHLLGLPDHRCVAECRRAGEGLGIKA